MFKLWYLLKSADDPFQASGTAAKDLAQSNYPELAGYVQTRSLPDQETEFSGAVELFFATAAVAIKASETDVNALLNSGVEIEARVVGMERTVMRSPAWFETDRIKGVYPFCRRGDLSVADFQNHWWHTHGPIAALTEEALSYTQLHPLPETYDSVKPDYDGVTEIAWPDRDAANRALVSRQMVEDQGSDAPNFVDMESIALFMAQEEVVIAP